jgi:hypothetical protein
MEQHWAVWAARFLRQLRVQALAIEEKFDAGQGFSQMGKYIAFRPCSFLWVVVHVDPIANLYIFELCAANFDPELGDIRGAGLR